MNENSVFSVFHPDAMDLFHVCSSLEKVTYMYMYMCTFCTLYMINWAYMYMYIHVHEMIHGTWCLATGFVQ